MRGIGIYSFQFKGMFFDCMCDHIPAVGDFDMVTLLLQARSTAIGGGLPVKI